MFILKKYLDKFTKVYVFKYNFITELFMILKRKTKYPKYTILGKYFLSL